MKKLLIIIVTLTYFTGQSQGYNLNVTTNAYNSLAGSTSLNNATVWDNPAFTFPIGFNFKLYNTVFNNGYINPNGDGGIVTAVPNATNTMPTLIPFSTDILDRGFLSGTSLSNISYKLDGSSGNRILKIEWNNVGFFGDLNVNGTSTDFANFQVWLYETTNVVEFRFGPSNITNPSVSFEGDTGPGVALFPLVNFNTGEITSGIILSGNPSAPIVNNTNVPLSLDAIPSNGITYRFSPTPLSINEFEKKGSIALYPNPAEDYLYVENKNINVIIEDITILDTTGKVVKRKTFSYEKIETNDLNSGLYFIEFRTNLGLITKKFIKK